MAPRMWSLRPIVLKQWDPYEKFLQKDMGDPCVPNNGIHTAYHEDVALLVSVVMFDHPAKGL